MTTDAAALSFSIDSREAVSATEALDRMVRSSTEASTGVRRLSEASTQGQAALRDLAQQGVLLDTTLRQVGTGVDGLIQRVQLLSRELGTFQATSREMQTALGQLRAAGELFGTSAAGLDAFARASRSVGQNSFEMVQSLQRIQQAIEGTTAAGERARQVLRNLGVEIEGRRPDEAADIFREAVRARNRFASDSRRPEEDAIVFGRMSIETLATIGNENYKTEEQRRRDAELSVLNPRVLQTQQSISERASAMQQRQREYDDLRREYRDFGDSIWGDTSMEGMRRRRDSGNYTPRSLAYTWQENADGTANLRGDPRWGERLASTLGMPGEGYIGGFVRALRERVSSTGFDINQRDIAQRYNTEAQESEQSGNWFGTQGGWFGRQLRFLTRSQLNVGGAYAPVMDTQQRPNLFRTPGYDYATGNIDFAGSMSAEDRQRQALIIQSAQEFGPGINTSGFDRLSPGQIMQQLPDWASAAVRRRFDALDRNQANENERARGDADLGRRASLGRLGRADLFGLDPDQLDLGSDTTTNQDAAERARRIAQAIIGIRKTFNNIDAQAEELRRVNDEITKDFQARDQVRTDRLRDGLAFTARTAGLVTDANPANRARNAGQMAYETTLRETKSEEQALLAGQQALTNAIINLDRTMNEMVRQGELALGTAVGNYNAYVGNAPIPRFNGGATELGGGVFAPTSRLPGASANVNAGAAAAVGDRVQAMFEALRQEFPGIRATSGLRPGDTGSQHQHGNALDLDLSQLSMEERGSLYRRVTSREGDFRYLGGIGTYDRTGRSLHIDTRTGAPMAWGPNRSRTSLDQTPQAFQEAVAQWRAGGTEERPGAWEPVVTAARAPAEAGSDITIPGLLNWTPARTTAEAYARAGNRTLEASAVGRTQGMANGGAREETIGRFIDEGAVQALARLVQSIDQANAAHLNNLEVLRASTTAERELTQARQTAERETARIRGIAAETRDPAYRRALLQTAETLVPDAERRTREGLAGRFNAGLDRQQRDLADAEAENDNWFMTNAERARARGQRQARRGAQDMGFAFDGPEADRAAGLAGRTSELQELARQNQMIRDSFMEVGNSATTALSQIILRGGDARQVMKGLLADLAAMAFRRAALGLVEKGFSALGGLFSGGGTPGVAGTDAALAGGVTDSAGNIMGYAQGGTFTRAFGSGDVVSTPTYFPLADGNRGLVGEAGRPEAILPLTRDANGNLGVAAGGGGGGGHTVNVTVNNSGGGGTSPDQAKNIAILVSKAIDEANQKHTMEQMRVGGAFNPLYQAS